MSSQPSSQPGQAGGGVITTDLTTFTYVNSAPADSISSMITMQIQNITNTDTPMMMTHSDYVTNTMMTMMTTIMVMNAGLVCTYSLACCQRCTATTSQGTAPPSCAPAWHQHCDHVVSIVCLRDSGCITHHHHRHRHRHHHRQPQAAYSQYISE